MKAAIYIRVSTDEQTKGYGIESQVSQCTQYCNAFGIEIVDTYIDAGISGTKPIEDRPALHKAIENSKAGSFDILVTAKIDRLGRKANIVLNIWDTLDNAGIAIVAVKERVDTTTPAGKLHRTMLAAIAEFERDNIVQRTTDGRNERAKIDGDKGGSVPFGYTRVIQELHNIVVNENEANIVQTIFQLREQGLSLHKIAAHLNKQGIPTPRNGKTWYAKTVSIILSNEPIYKGSSRGDSQYTYPVILNNSQKEGN